MTFSEKIDAKTTEWIRQEYQTLTADPDYSPNTIHVQNLLELWEEDNPKMLRRLKAEKLSKQFAQVILAKKAEQRDQMELAGYPPTDAREQAEMDWYIQPENPNKYRSPLEDLLDPREVRLQTPLYK